jgi:Ca-activated chloride channel family protein
MAEQKPNRTLLIFGFAIFVAGVVLATVLATLSWEEQTEQETVTETEEEAAEVDPGEVLRPNADETDEQLSIYDLPDHSGRLVAERDGDRFGLPRIEASYDVDIRGDLASVVVEQSFKNPTDATLHPEYQFPLYAEAAVYAMEMRIGDRVIEADVKRKDEARKEYERARAQGKKAALLSQNRPNLFTQRVANLAPGQQVDITIRYTHTVPKVEGAYRLLVPLAVGERFTPPDMSDSALVDGEKPDPGQTSGPTIDAHDVALDVRIDGGMPVSGVQSATHAIRLYQLSETDSRIELADGEIPADEHFRLRYRLAGDDMSAGINAYWDEAEQVGYFNLRVEPPLSPAPEQAIQREMVFAIDKSGSMRGGPINDTKRFVRKSLEHLRPTDRFRIVLFSDNASEFADEPLQATPENIERAQVFLERLSVGGGTMMERGIRQVLEPEVPEGTLRLVTFLTDGQINNEFGMIELLRGEVGNARMFAVGVGSRPNMFLLEEMGRAGRGFTEVLDPDAPNDDLIDDAVEKLQTPVLTGISIDWGELDVDEVTPHRPPDLFAGGSVKVHGRYTKPGGQTVVIHGRSAGGQILELPLEVELPDASSQGEAVELAWARQRIADSMHLLQTPAKLRQSDLSDEQLREKIIELGLEHDLSTQWTSFVAVDEHGPIAEQVAPETEVEPESAERRRRSVRRVPRQRTPAKGFGGLGLSGNGRGGVGKAEAISGLGSGAGAGYGKGAGDLGRETQAKKPSVVPRQPTVRGSLDKEIVRRVVRQHRKQIKYCYEKELQASPKLSGTVVVRFVIDAGGNVTAASIKETTLGDSAVESCLLRVIRRWVFPRPKGGGVVIVNYPFAFDAS